ncbi:MAG: large-conductance mechanosensitive channel protein MscL [Patescibacteria group bacterium]
MFNEFKDFAIKGNVMDMAVGIIIGGAFGKIVSSLVVDVIMPPIGLLLGGVDFSKFSFVLREASDSAEAVSINYGLFVNNIVEFLIIAFSIFIIIKQLNRLKKKEIEVSPSEEVLLLREIRDNLKK